MDDPIAELHAGAQPSWWQPVRGTLVLAAVGAGVGALLGTTLLAALLASGPGGPSRYDVRLGLIMGAPVGAVTGLLAAPLLGWTLLREVPLGRALWMGGVGILLGEWSAARFLPGLLASVHVGVVGLVLGALTARYATRRARAEAPMPVGPDEHAS